MPVAKSFKNLPTIGEPYEKNGRQYILIKYPDSHTREVRWYSALEYAKMYPDEVPDRPWYGPSKDALGFAAGPITIFGEVNEANDEWLRNSSARYHRIWGWYFISTEKLPQLPTDLVPKHLPWELVGDAEGYPLNDKQIKEGVAEVLYEESPSQFQGTIGDRIDRELTITKAIELDGSYYGPSTMHIMTDPQENVYIWNTAAKKLEVGKTYQIRGTVKEHKRYQKTAQTILIRCSVQQ